MISFLCIVIYVFVLADFVGGRGFGNKIIIFMEKNTSHYFDIDDDDDTRTEPETDDDDDEM